MQYRFDHFVLDTETGTLSGPQGSIPLRRRAFVLLAALLEHAPALLPREQILDEVWGHSALTANVLPQAIGEIRQALGDNAQQPHLVETRHRLGYRIKVLVERIDPQAQRPIPTVESPPAPSAPPLRRVPAVAWLLAGLLLTTVLAWVWTGASHERTPEPRNEQQLIPAAAPVLALALSDSGESGDWLAAAGLELLSVALAADDRIELLRSDGRRPAIAGHGPRWQAWLADSMAAGYALTGAW